MTDKPVQSFVSYASDSNYEQGLRPYFVYRDLGIKDATDGKVLAHVIRTNQSCDGAMGYHSHALDFQMVYMIKGWQRMDFEDIGEVRVEAGDSWFQAQGIKHEVLEYSDDIEVLEITMPADFETQAEQRP